jgi:hypothetical protein
MPTSEADIATSLALTSHHYSIEQLKEISAQSVHGRPPLIKPSPGKRDAFLRAAKEVQTMLASKSMPRR